MQMAIVDAAKAIRLVAMSLPCGECEARSVLTGWLGTSMRPQDSSWPLKVSVHAKAGGESGERGLVLVLQP